MSIQKYSFLFGVVFALLTGCSSQRGATGERSIHHMGPSRTEIDLQGHRGARGLLPENSIPAFRRALEIGVRTLEMDVVVSADKKVVVSHEPWFSSSICLTPDGEAIPKMAEQSQNLYWMAYDEIEGYDCGSKGNDRFPEQEALRVSKPLLSDVIETAEEYAAELGRPAPRYNIEIKSKPSHDRKFHPPPEEYARLLYNVLDDHDVLDRSTVQSFDVRALRAVRSLDEDVSLALLVDNRRGFDRNIKSLGFLPEIYSPAYKLVNQRLIDRAHRAGVEILPWTVNEPQVMRRLLEMGVDGLITDYPDLGREVVDAYLRDRS